ncbi:PKD domain-containing protein [Microbacterium sp. UFMG61]|uniref:PKD domain-containing protein n=1 Tax=Microbacterium sp. UFMG61 TaxID=2745935 RepID=UPI00188EF7E0|nr:PKD domain-containing protein [Microbacterium sp. UFMG61]
MHINWGGRIVAAEKRGVRRSRGVSLLGAIATALALTVGALTVPVAAVADTTPAAGTPETFAADALPTVQIDGVVYAQEVVGNTVYVGGSFAKARPAGAAAGTNETPRANLLAYDLTTGALITSWNPGTNGTVLDIKKSADGSRIYVAGMFSQAAGVWRYRVAAFDTATGALITSWAPEANGRIDSLAVTDGAIYMAGEFTTINGTQRTKVASVSPANGSITGFTADVQGGYGAKGVVVSPDNSKVVIAGSFTSVNGSTNPGRGITALDANTGTLMPWAMNSVLRNAGTVAAMYSLSSDGDSVYGTGFDYGGTSQDGFEGGFRANWSDGSLVWMEDCHGDSYDIAPTGDTIYVVGHPHYCGNVAGFPETNPRSYKHSLAFAKAPSGQLITNDTQGYRNFAGQPSGSLLQWYPEYVPGTYTGQSQGPWQVTAAGDYLLIGGEFLKVNGAAQQGIVRFAKKTVAPNKQGPQVQGGAWTLSATSFQTGVNRLSWNANYDRDNQSLHYLVFRQDKGMTTPIFETDQVSNFWTRPAMSYKDSTAVPGTTYNYRIRAVDSFGNSTQSDWTPVTTAAAGVSTAYDEAILASGAVDYWPLTEPSGTTSFDWAGGNDLVVAGGTRGTAGPNLATPSTATTFSGTSSSAARTTTSVVGPKTFTVEAWFKTNSTRGGKIVGFGSSATGNSSSYDRHVYLDNSGRVTFGVYTGSTQTITSATGFNDNKWHHVVASLSATGQVLYLDGVKIGDRTDTVAAQDYTGYWRIGGDNLGSWPSVGASSYLNGAISNVAVYDRALTRSEIDAHWVASGRTTTIPAAPADAYGKSVFDLDPTLFWRLSETGTATTAADSGMNKSTGTYTGSSSVLVKGQTGAISGLSNTAVRWAPTTGTTTARLAGTKQYPNPQIFSVEAWFKTTTSAGGKIVGFGDSNSGLSSSNDRHIYMTPDGKLNFGVYTTAQNLISTTGSYNNGQWHHVVGQLSGDGMKFYVDGALVGTNPNKTAQNYNGYWRVGNDTGWGGATTFTGTIDEVAVYSTALTADQVNEHYQLGAFGSVNQVPTAAFSGIPTNLDVAFDASTSVDPDGAIASYRWDFGDDATSTEGPAAAHTYAAGGTYQVKLTVTDDRGATATVTQPVTVQAANVMPTAAFDAVTTHMSVAVDASASTDSDGTLATYSWAFGDGAVGSGKTTTHAYTTPGEYTVTLTVTDDRSGSATTTKQVVVDLAPNVLPTASLAATINNLAASLDASASADSDGQIVSYAWDFGDSTPQTTTTTPTTTHDYAAGGAYTVTVTVTDNRGGTATASKPLTAVEPPKFTVIANDKFARTVSPGWGTAEVGGAWTTSGGNASFSSTGTAGRIVSNIYDTRGAMLNSVSSKNSDLTVKFTVDRTGAGYSWTLIGRQVGSDNYSARVRFEAGNTMRLYILRGETAIGSSLVLPGTYTAGTELSVRLQVTGTSPTTVRAKVWSSASAEPTAWQLSGTDSTAALQNPGSVGLLTYLGGSSVTPNATMEVRSFSVVDPSAPTAPNQLPSAAFTPTTAGLKVSVDAAASTDADGTIQSYAWTFGDNSNATGVTATHTYAAAGTYPVTLTVTDDRGGVSTKKIDVTVAPAPNQAPVAAFTPTVTGLSVAVDGAASSDPDGTIQSHAWTFGDGGTATGATASHTYLAAGTFDVTLTVTDNSGTTTAVTKQVTVTAPPANQPLATDAFGRTVAAGGWGSADLGGAWTLSGGAAAYSVADGKGIASLAPASTRTARLGLSGTDAVIRVSISADAAATGGAATATVIGRQVGASNYSARVRFEVGGGVRLYLLRDEVALGSYLMPGFTYTPGTALNVAFSATGTAPTALAAKVWVAGTTEPATWQTTANDTTAAMQAAGTVGLMNTVSSASTVPTTVFRWDDLTITKP